MPACNVQVMGQQKNFGMGLSNIAASNMPHIGVLFYCDLVQVGVIASLCITMVSDRVHLELSAFPPPKSSESGRRKSDPRSQVSFFPILRIFQ